MEQSLFENLVRLRRQIHANPALGYQENILLLFAIQNRKLHCAYNKKLI